MRKNIAIIFAGGTGLRFSPSDKPKQFMLLDGIPVIIHTITLFESHSAITDIIVVCLDDWKGVLQDLLIEYKIKKVRSIVSGGQSTQESIFKGLCETEAYTQGEDAVVLIHDGVRPLICEQTITDNIESVRHHGSCITCALPTETIIVQNEKGIEIPRRKDMLVARAPQSFMLSDILKTHRQALVDGNTGFVDCCEMMRYYNRALNMVMGPIENIKITTISDFYMCEALMKMKKDLNG